mgnify:CR=1 FL=1
MNNYYTPKVKKCVNCNGKFRRKSDSRLGETEPYKGNMMCYNTKETKHYQTIQQKNVNGGLELVKGDYTHSTYSYVLWDEESYYHEGGYFCSGKCSKEFGQSCAEQGVRRLGQSLVRYNRGDRRASW